MESAEVRVGERVIGPVSPHLFGGLTEHFGTGIYGGLWDAERDLPRADVQAAVRALGTTVLRYPGGCFSDWYHWRDGVGPKQRRPTHDQTYWTTFRFADVAPPATAHLFELSDRELRQFGPVETNDFGTDEFLRYCLDVDAEPMLVVNVGSGTPQEAADWVAYTNRSGEAPRPVTWWGIGNELYGPWEIGHCPPEVYGARFVDYARAMRAVDPDIRLVAVGCGGGGPYEQTWNATVVEAAADHLDALSVHWYFPGTWIGRDLRDDEADYLQLASGSDRLGAMLDAVIAEVDAVVGPERALPLSLDEWNMWATLPELLQVNRRQSDGVFFAGCFNRMLERADRIGSAMISHLVNCMAPIQTRGDRHFVTASYLVAMLYRRHVRSEAVAVEVACARMTVPPFADTAAGAGHETAVLAASTEAEASSPTVDATATRDRTGTTVFLANRRFDQPVSVRVTGLPAGAAGRFRYLHGEPFAVNDVDRPDAIGFRDRAVTVDDRGHAVLELPPHTAGALVVTTVPAG